MSAIMHIYYLSRFKNFFKICPKKALVIEIISELSSRDLLE